MARDGASTVMIVIVNYRTGGLVVDCLRSLATEVAAYPSSRVVVVDNASGDGSADVIAAAIEDHGWQDWARLLLSPTNGGFATGNNLAIRSALHDETPPDLFWLLNPDTRVQPGALGAFIDFFDTNPGAGIAGCQLLQGDEAPWPFAFRFPSALSELERGACIGTVTKLLRNYRVPIEMGDMPRQVDWVSGASMVLRRSMLESIGLMDEGYFLYFEETDLSRKAALNGWSCWYLPDAVVMHIAGQSTGLTDKQSSRIPRYWFDSRRRYFIANHGQAYAIMTDLSWLAGHLMWRTLRPFRSRQDTATSHLMRDFIARSALFHGPRAR